MNSQTVKDYADWLQQNTSKIVAGQVSFDAQKVYDILDDLKIFDQPSQSYLQMTQESFYDTVSDHKLTIGDETKQLTALQDRILINHVDGSITDQQLNFAYNHEDNYEGGYQARKELNLLAYGFKVLGAVLAISEAKLVRENLSTDAAMSLLLAAHALDGWQKTHNG